MLRPLHLLITIADVSSQQRKNCDPRDAKLSILHFYKWWTIIHVSGVVSNSGIIPNESFFRDSLKAI